MRRRAFLIGAICGGIGSVAGCSGLGQPAMEFRTFVVSDPVPVSADNVENEYVGTTHNRGDHGTVRVELWFFGDSAVSNPEAAAMYVTDDRSDRHFDLARSRWFDAAERREVSILGDTDPPMPPESREFGLMPWPASHGAIFENTGETGEVEFRLEYRDARGYDPEEPPTQLETVGGGEPIEIQFETVTPPGAEYEILAEPG